MADLFFTLPYVVDLDKPVTKTMLYNLFVTTNKKAHRFIITLRRSGVEVPFTGSVVGTLINYSDMMTQEYPGRAEDGKVVFDWPDSFYAKSGLFCVIITVDDGEVSNSVFAAEGSMILGETDILYDPSHVVPSLAELLAQIEATRNAATAANTAANSANSAATDANSAADRANDAAQSIEGLTVSASPGAAADAEITEQDGTKHIHFTLKTGATPDITFEVATGAPGTQVQVQQSGTPEAPNVLLTIPRGDTGAVEGIDYFAGDPSALGTANPGTANGVARGDHVHPMPTAEQVGAIPAGSAVGGYENRADNSDFRQFVAQRGISGTHGTQAYAGDRWKLISGAITGEANSNGNGYKNVTLNGTIRQVVANPEDVMTAFVGTISGTATASYADGELTIASSGGVLDWVLLLPGEWDSAPTYVSKGYAAELLECQRYYYQVPSDGNMFYVGFVALDNEARVTVYTPVPMRVTPSLICDEPTKAIMFEATKNAYATGCYIKFMDKNGVGVGLTYASGSLTRYANMSMRWNSANVAFSADL